MGGIVGLTIRFTDGKEWRGSCWTNILPDSLFAPEFYMHDKSEAHVKEWLTNLKRNRKKEPELERMWGNWKKLAPVEYGLIVIDYKTDSFFNKQGYSGPENDTLFHNENYQKFVTLYDAGLVTAVRYEGGKTFCGAKGEELEKLVQHAKRAARVGSRGKKPVIRGKDVSIIQADYKLPFKNIRLGIKCNHDSRWVENRFKLNAKEKAAWRKF